MSILAPYTRAWDVILQLCSLCPLSFEESKQVKSAWIATPFDHPVILTPATSIHGWGLQAHLGLETWASSNMTSVIPINRSNKF